MGVWRENKTFERRSTAHAWIETREKELSKPDALTDLTSSKGKKRNPTLADAIDRYVQDSEKAMGRTKAQVLRAIKEFDIADKVCDEITIADVVEFARQKLETGVQPQTVANYMSHLGAVFSISRAAWGFPLDDQAMTNAWKVVKKLGFTEKTGQKIGNDVWCDLPAEAATILSAMPRNDQRIFPYSTDAISASFTRATKLLGISDLRFHDLCHEGVSRLFEMGLNIPHVAAVSGHKSWVSLRRYTHLRQTGDKFEGWSWLPAVSGKDHTIALARERFRTKREAN